MSVGANGRGVGLFVLIRAPFENDGREQYAQNDKERDEPDDDSDKEIRARVIAALQTRTRDGPRTVERGVRFRLGLAVGTALARLWPGGRLGARVGPRVARRVRLRAAVGPGRKFDRPPVSVAVSARPGREIGAEQRRSVERRERRVVRARYSREILLRERDVFVRRFIAKRGDESDLFARRFRDFVLDRREFFVQTPARRVVTLR